MDQTVAVDGAGAGEGAVDQTVAVDGAGVDGAAVGVAGVDAVEGACEAVMRARSSRCGGSIRAVGAGAIAGRLRVCGLSSRVGAGWGTAAAGAGLWAASAGGAAGAGVGAGPGLFASAGLGAESAGTEVASFAAHPVSTASLSTTC